MERYRKIRLETDEFIFERIEFKSDYQEAQKAQTKSVSNARGNYFFRFVNAPIIIKGLDIVKDFIIKFFS